MTETNPHQNRHTAIFDEPHSVSKKAAIVREFPVIPDDELKDLMASAVYHNQVRAGNVVSGSVIKVKDDSVILDLGGKSEAIVPIRNVQNIEDLKVGSQFNVFVRDSDSHGEVIVSTHEVKNKEAWEKIYNAEKNRETVRVVIEEQREAGSNGKIEGTNIAAFLPRSHSAKHFEPIQDCLILSVDRRNNSVVVSRKLVLESSYREAKEKFIDSLEEDRKSVV